MSLIILLNGAPKTGKDCLAEHFVSKWNFKRLKFADPIREAIIENFNISDDEIDDWKSKPIGNGKIGRDFMIAWSECIIKPIKGEDFFAVKLVEKIFKERKHHTNFIISDCGFQTEVDYLLSHLEPEDKVIIIRLHREGCNFLKDSRMHIKNNDFINFDIENNGTIEDLFLRVESLLINLTIRH